MKIRSKRRHVTRTHASNASSFFSTFTKNSAIFFSCSFTSIPINQISTAAGKRTQWEREHTYTYNGVSNVCKIRSSVMGARKMLRKICGAREAKGPFSQRTFFMGEKSRRVDLFDGGKLSVKFSSSFMLYSCGLHSVVVGCVVICVQWEQNGGLLRKETTCGAAVLCAFINLTGFKRSKNVAAAANHRNSRCRRHLLIVKVSY